MITAAVKYGPDKFVNRELSWLEFNQRVLDEALDASNPLLERVKFFTIASSNLDEFFEVRVAGLKQQMESESAARSVDGLTPSEALRAIATRVRQMVDQQYNSWREDLIPSLARNKINFLDYHHLNEADRHWVENYYQNEVLPVLTPLAIDPAHPFPQLLNKSLNLIVRLEMKSGDRTIRHLAVVQVPRVLPRLVPLPRTDGSRDYIYLGNLIGHHLANLFPGTSVVGFWHFRVTRNSELYIDEEEAANLLKAVESELINRMRGQAVRLEVDKNCPDELRQALLKHLKLSEDDVYLIDGPLNPTRLSTVWQGDHSPELRDPPFVPKVLPQLADPATLFETIRKGDTLLHHPFESFESVVSFLETAAEDPKVLAIKQTLYRTGGDRRIIGALMNAVNNGKQVTAVVELRARFDEANNIKWAQQLEEAGVLVVYGLVGYKIHAKMSLVVRRDEDGIRRYVHLGTGNYNPTTAKLYTDVGLLTCRPLIGEDVTNIFNLLTGISQFQGTHCLLVAPYELHSRMVAKINREAVNARQGLPARIIAKMNALVDERIIEALYDASQAGVKIDLIVRGVCCLRPGIPGVSENITVRSIVDRFLEHSRIFYFENACHPEVFVGSADWMPRNFFRRIEVVFPIEDGVLRERLIAEILGTVLKDNTKARRMHPDGSYTKGIPVEGEVAHRSQMEFMAMAQPLPQSTGGGEGGKDLKMKLAKRPKALKKTPSV